MLGRFERKIVLLLVAVAVVPVAGAWFAADRLVSHSLEVGLNPRVRDALERQPQTFRDFLSARKAAYRTAFDGLHRSASLLDTLGAGDALGLEALFQDFVASNLHVASVTVFDASDRPIATATAPTERAENAWRPLPLATPLDDLPGGTGHRLEAVFVIGWHHFREFEADARALGTYRTLMTSREGLAGGYRVAFGVMLGAVVLLTALAGFSLARRVTRPVDPLIAATRRVAAGDLDVSAPPGPDDEIGDLCRAFDSMVAQMREDRDRIAFLTRLGASQDMARRLAHEIKNPLTPITLAVQQLVDRYRGEDDAFEDRLRTAAEIVREEVGALRRLVDEFRAFARLPEVSLEPADLAAEVRHFVDAHGRFADAADVNVQGPDAPLPVRLDRVMFRRVLANLVDNAIEAAEPDHRPSIVLALRPSEEGRTLLAVHDDGPGVPDAEAARIFEPYQTGKRTGTGLGLSIAKKVVLDHGGTLRVVASDLLGGAAFEVRLPPA